MVCDDWLRIMNECSMLNVEKKFSTIKTICAKVAILIDSSVGNVKYDSLRSLFYVVHCEFFAIRWQNEAEQLYKK